MLNSCPKFQSCGTLNPVWTDGKEPKQVGVSIRTGLYVVLRPVGNNVCRKRPHSTWLEVIRCSWDTDHDLIYRLVGYYANNCHAAFCGMM